MACPYFVPLEILNDGSWAHPARLPLGAGWSGSCCAPRKESATDELADEPFAVDAACVRDFCNLGYASACPRIPRDRDWDAVRFSVAGSSPEQITLLYVCELNHAPVEHGTLSFEVAGEVWRDAPRDPRVRRLANSFLHAYRIRQTASLI